MIEQDRDAGILNLEQNGSQADIRTLREISEGIEGSAKNGPYWLGTDNPRQFLANYTRVGLLKERILTRSLPALEIRLTEVQSISSTGTIEFPHVPDQDEIKRKAKEAHIRKFEEDTADVKFRRMEQKLVDYYKKELLGADFVPADRVWDHMWDADVDKLTKSNRLTTYHNLINKKLEKEGWKIKNKFQRNTQVAGQYFLGFTEELTPHEEIQPPIETLDKRPSLEVDLRKREVKISGMDGVVRLADNVDWRLFQMLYEKHEEGITLYERELRELVKREKNIPIANNQLLALVASIDSINSTFNEGFKLDKENSLIVISREGRVTIYKLEVKDVNFVKPPEIPDAEITPLIFPDTPKIEQIGFLGEGEILTIPYEPSEDEKRSEVENRMLFFIVDSINKNRPVTFEELQVAVTTNRTMTTQPHGRVKIDIYQTDELKEMFAEALRKIREESEITGLKSCWNPEDEVLFNNLQESIGRLSGRDILDFQTKIKRMIDISERRFYNSLPADQRAKKILFIIVDSKELEGRQ